MPTAADSVTFGSSYLLLVSTSTYYQQNPSRKYPSLQQIKATHILKKSVSLYIFTHLHQPLLFIQMLLFQIHLNIKKVMKNSSCQSSHQNLPSIFFQFDSNEESPLKDPQKQKKNISFSNGFQQSDQTAPILSHKKQQKEATEMEVIKMFLQDRLKLSDSSKKSSSMQNHSILNKVLLKSINAILFSVNCSKAQKITIQKEKASIASILKTHSAWMNQEQTQIFRKIIKNTCFMAEQQVTKAQVIDLYNRIVQEHKFSKIEAQAKMNKQKAAEIQMLEEKTSIGTKIWDKKNKKPPMKNSLVKDLKCCFLAYKDDQKVREEMQKKWPIYDWSSQNYKQFTNIILSKQIQRRVQQKMSKTELVSTLPHFLQNIGTQVKNKLYFYSLPVGSHSFQKNQELAKMILLDMHKAKQL